MYRAFEAREGYAKTLTQGSPNPHLFQAYPSLFSISKAKRSHEMVDGLLGWFAYNKIDFNVLLIYQSFKHPIGTTNTPSPGRL